MAQLVKNLPAMQETPVRFLGQENRWRRDRLPPPVFLGFPCGSTGKESACNAGDLSSIPGLGRSPREGKGYPLQNSGLENSMDGIVHGVAESDATFTFTLICNAKLICKMILNEFLRGSEIPDEGGKQDGGSGPSQANTQQGQGLTCVRRGALAGRRGRLTRLHASVRKRRFSSSLLTGFLTLFNEQYLFTSQTLKFQGPDQQTQSLIGWKALCGLTIAWPQDRSLPLGWRLLKFLNSVR